MNGGEFIKAPEITAVLLGVTLQLKGNILSLQLAPHGGALRPAKLPFSAGEGMEQQFSNTSHVVLFWMPAATSSASRAGSFRVAPTSVTVPCLAGSPDFVRSVDKIGAGMLPLPFKEEGFFL